jgi:hypothetical protein
MKTLILYAFHQLSESVDYFIKNGLFEHPDYHFIFICNSLIPIPNLVLPPYVAIVYRMNLGYDFGAWSDVLLENNLYEQYDQFFFLNSTVIGPFIPNYCTKKWTDIYLDQLTEDIRLFGLSINGQGLTREQPMTSSRFPHVQSMVFCMKKSTLEYLISRNIFCKISTNDKVRIIEQHEIRMSIEIIRNGWNFGCMLEYYRGIDFRNLDSIFQKPLLDDTCYFNNLLGHPMHPYETIFIKVNRYLDSSYLNNYKKIERIQ